MLAAVKDWDDIPHAAVGVAFPLLHDRAWPHADGARQHVPDDATALILSLH